MCSSWRNKGTQSVIVAPLLQEQKLLKSPSARVNISNDNTSVGNAEESIRENSTESAPQRNVFMATRLNTPAATFPVNTERSFR